MAQTQISIENFLKTFDAVLRQREDKSLLQDLLEKTTRREQHDLKSYEFYKSLKDGEA